jgi:hypothetical protein
MYTSAFRYLPCYSIFLLAPLGRQKCQQVGTSGYVRHAIERIAQSLGVDRLAQCIIIVDRLIATPLRDCK